MRRKLGMASMVLGLAMAVGCTKSDSISVSDGGAGSAPDEAVATSHGTDTSEGRLVEGAALETDPPARIAYEFIEACRRGEDDRVQATLTPLARQKIASLGGSIGLSARDDVAYRVDRVRYLTEDGAVVAVSELQRDGESDEVVTQELMVGTVRQAEGWRVQVMALQPFHEGGDWVKIDFENPEATRRELQKAKEDAFRYMQELAVAQASDSPVTGEAFAPIDPFTISEGAVSPPPYDAPGMGMTPLPPYGAPYGAPGANLETVAPPTASNGYATPAWDTPSTSVSPIPQNNPLR